MSSLPTRRKFLAQTSSAAVHAAMLGSLLVPRSVHAGMAAPLKLGLIGAGGRGTGAAADALHADPEAVLTSLGDVFEDQARRSLHNLQRDEEVGTRVQVDGQQLHWGFDAFQKVIDSDVDVVILATPPHFRPAHLEYAIDRQKHCFVEKPVAVDVPGILRAQAACEKAKQLQLAVVTGLCYRYHPGVVETIDRIRDGAIGEIIAIQSHYNSGTLWHRGDQADWSRMEYQLRNWLYYTWLSGDHIVEQAVHSLDKTAWLQGDVAPSTALGIGGRQQRTDPQFGHIYDHFTVFYEYPSGIRTYFTCRQQDNCSTFVDEIVLGTAGTARILAHQIMPRGGSVWKFDREVPSMYRLEHEALFRSIREGQPINDGHLMCNSTLLAIMGRISAYSGQTLTWDELLAHTERLGPSEYGWVDIPEPSVPIPGR